MAELHGVDFGETKKCRVCQSELFLVEKGRGTINDKPISVLTIRCYRCGTVLDQLQIDWSASTTEKDKVVVEDGIKR